MADKDSAPTFNPKHRILGAVIVVSLAVIVVPLILDRHEPPGELKDPSATHEPKPGETRVVVTPVAELGAMPTRPSARPVANPTPPPVAAARPVTDPMPPVRPEPLPEPAPAADKPAAPAAVKKEPAKAAPAKTKTKTSAKTKKGWAVQVGVFSNPENAKRMIEKLGSLGVKASSETITLSGNKVQRLRVGPYRDRASAEREQARIQKGIGEKLVVVAWP